MNALRTGTWTKKVLAVLLLCSLLLQIQTVFACQMMDHSGPIEQCCCDDMATSKGTTEASDERLGCCDISNELTIKAMDTDGDEPVAISSHSSLDPPAAALVFLLVTLWPELVQSQPSPATSDLDADPGHPGTQTYLSTLRLRI